MARPVSAKIPAPKSGRSSRSTVVTTTDASGLTTYTYDYRDRVLTKATPQGTLTYAYQPNSLVASVVSSNADGISIGYAYDSLNRLETVTERTSEAR